jgi:transcription initiation factor TFIID subunit 4
MTNDVKSQIKFIEELDKIEKKKKDDAEREKLMKAAKSRSKGEDTELIKMKQKAKEVNIYSKITRKLEHILIIFQK